MQSASQIETREAVAAAGVVIRVEEAHKYYELGETRVHALRGVSVEIQRREFLAIMGASGSGKSTFMNILGCLDRPSSGQYLLEGIDVSKHDKRALALVGLADRAEHFPSQMSGGQQQRVAVARALVNRPSILLADEPTGNLDSRTSVEIMEVFQDLNDKGLTIVMVTHEHDVAQFAKRVLVFRDGKIRKDDPIVGRPIASEVLKTLPTLED